MSDKLTTYDENARDGDLVDRVWAATRPADLADDAFDQIWAKVQEAHDTQSTVLTMRPARAWAFLPIALAAAAGLLVAAVVLNRPVDVNHADQTPGYAVIVSDPFDLEPHETLVIEINGPTVRNHRLEPEAKNALALNDIPANSSTDVLNWMEAHAND